MRFSVSVHMINPCIGSSNRYYCCMFIVLMWLLWQRPLSDQKRVRSLICDQIPIPQGENLGKISLADFEIICLKGFIS